MNIFGVMAAFRDKAGDEQLEIIGLVDDQNAAKNEAKTVAAKIPHVSLGDEEGAEPRKVHATLVLRFRLNAYGSQLIARYEPEPAKPEEEVKH